MVSRNETHRNLNGEIRVLKIISYQLKSWYSYINIRQYRVQGKHLSGYEGHYLIVKRTVHYEDKNSEPLNVMKIKNSEFTLRNKKQILNIEEKSLRKKINKFIIIRENIIRP